MSKPFDQQRLCARVYGRVQGVGYRQYVAHAADKAWAGWLCPQ